MSVRLYVCLYVCLSVCMSGLGGNVIFSAPIQDKALIFCVHISLVYELLFYKYFGHRSVGQATKSKIASLLMDMPNLFFWPSCCIDFKSDTRIQRYKDLGKNKKSEKERDNRRNKKKSWMDEVRYRADVCIQQSEKKKKYIIN